MFLKENDTIVFAGDSITDTDRKRPEGEDIYDFKPWGQGFVNLLGGQLLAKYPHLNLRIINRGIGGNQSQDLLERFDDDILSCRPNIVPLMIGINDVWPYFSAPSLSELHESFHHYRSNVETMIQKCREAGATVVLMAPYIIEPNRQDAMRIKMSELGGICKELAEKYQLTFIDLQAAFDRVLEYYHPYALAWDRIHPDVIGHTVIANAFLDAIGM